MTTEPPPIWLETKNIVRNLHVRLQLLRLLLLLQMLRVKSATDSSSIQNENDSHLPMTKSSDAAMRRFLFCFNFVVENMIWRRRWQQRRTVAAVRFVTYVSVVCLSNRHCAGESSLIRGKKWLKCAVRRVSDAQLISILFSFFCFLRMGGISRLASTLSHFNCWSFISCLIVFRFFRTVMRIHLGVENFQSNFTLEFLFSYLRREMRVQRAAASAISQLHLFSMLETTFGPAMVRVR